MSPNLKASLTAIKMIRFSLICLLFASLTSVSTGQEDKEYEAWKKSQEANVNRQAENYRRVMQVRIDELTYICQLDDQQLQRFELAAKGAIERCLVAYRDFQEKQWLRRKNGNRGAFPRLKPEDQNPPLQRVWVNAIANELSVEQKKIYYSEMQARIEYYAQLYIRTLVQQLDQQQRLTARQRAVLTETMQNSIPMPAVEGANITSTASIAVYKGLAKVPDEPIRQVLSPQQFKSWQEIKNRYERIYKNR